MNSQSNQTDKVADPAAIPTQPFVTQSPAPRYFASEEERLLSFRRGLDAIRRDAEAKIGAEDVEYIHAVARCSRRMEILGRVLIHVSFEPVTWVAGIVSLWIHKQLDTIEMGHSILHGTYNKLPGAEKFHAEVFRWQVPVDEASFRESHNRQHHIYTNIAGKDPDLRFGLTRLGSGLPYKWYHRFQIIWGGIPSARFFSMVNLEATGLMDVYFRSKDQLRMLPDKSWKSIVNAHKKALRKAVPYYLRDYGLYPALAGPFFWKVLVANFIVEQMRDWFTGVAVACSHVGEQVDDFPAGTRMQNRAEWYVAQVQTTHNFEVPYRISQLLGAGDYQIEHHLFPKLPPNRVREVAPAVRALCEEHGVHYKSDTWPRVIKKMLKRIYRLSQPAAQHP